MKIEYLKQFSKDLSKITNESLKESIFESVLNLKKANDLNEIPNIKNLKGYSNAYRLRVGKYRLEFYFDGEIIELGRFAKRDDIYKLFP